MIRFALLSFTFFSPVPGVGSININVPAMGDPACPCITYAQGAQDNWNEDELRQRVKWWAQPKSTKLSYGIGCKAHDKSNPFVHEECDVSHPTAVHQTPGFCQNQWCYVLPNCTVKSGVSKQRIGRFYSYATCGFKDKFQDYRNQHGLSGKTLTVTYLGNSGGWKGNYCVRGKGYSSCSGPIGEMFKSVFEQTSVTQDVYAMYAGGSLSSYNKTYQQQVMRQYLADVNLPPDTSKKISTFSPCVYATGMGFLDVCLAAIFQTSARQKLSNTIPVYSEPVILVSVKTPQSDGLIDWLANTFKPFQPMVWGALFGTIIFMSSMMLSVERASGGSYEAESLPHAALRTTYIGLNSFFSGGSAYEATTVGGKIIDLGFAFFLLLSISAYTANLATMLIVKKTAKAEVGSFKEVLADPTIKVCGLKSVLSVLETMGLSQAAQSVPILSRSDVIKLIGTDTCTVGAVLQEDLEKAQANGGDVPCNLLKVGDPIYYMDVMISVSERVSQTLKYHMLKFKEEGKWQKALSKNRPADGCAIQAEKDKDNSEHTGMSVKGMAGTLVVSLGFALTGVIVEVVRRCLGRRTSVDDLVNPEPAAGLSPEDVRAVVAQTVKEMAEQQVMFSNATKVSNTMVSNTTTVSNTLVMAEADPDPALVDAARGPTPEVEDKMEWYLPKQETQETQGIGALPSETSQGPARTVGSQPSEASQGPARTVGSQPSEASQIPVRSVPTADADVENCRPQSSLQQAAMQTADSLQQADAETFEQAESASRKEAQDGSVSLRESSRISSGSAFQLTDEDQRRLEEALGSQVNAPGYRKAKFGVQKSKRQPPMTNYDSC